VTRLIIHTFIIMCVHVQPVTAAKPRRGRQPLTPIADQRLEILKLSSSGTRAIAKQEEICMICDTGDGTLLHCNGPCLRVFHSRCIGLSVAPASLTFTCDECTTGMLMHFIILLLLLLLLGIYRLLFVCLSGIFL